MKLRILSLLLAVLLLSLCLCACGDKPEEEQGKTEEPVVDPTPDEPDEPEESEESDDPETPAESEDESGIPTDINMDSEYPVKRVDIGTTELSQYSIVIAEDANEYIVNAANELAKYIQQATGYELPVTIDTQSAAMHEICVGPTNRDTTNVKLRREMLTNDGIMYYVENGTLYLGSNSSRGNMYAVYHFLTDYLGWRCMSNHYEIFHEATYISIPKDLDYTYSSPLSYRQTDWGLNNDVRYKYSLNAGFGNENTIIGFCHTMSALSGCSADTQPCLTSEQTYQSVLNNLKKWIEANPGCRYISVTQNDNENYCTCATCQALADKENQSGVMLSFVNRLADAIKDEYPDVSLVTFAYRYTREAPNTIVPRDNVIVWMCSIECCFSHALNDPDCEENAAFCADLEDWMAITDRILFWDYTTNYHLYIAPFPNLMVIRENAAYLASHAVGIYEEGNYNSESAGEFSELRSYMLAKLLWNPNMSEEEYLSTLQEYCDDYYGPGGKYVYQYIQQTSEKVAEHHMGIYYCLNSDGCLYDKEGGGIDQSFVRKMTKLWDKAYAAAETDEQREHVADCRLQQDFMQLVADSMMNGVDHDANLAYLEKLRTLAKGGFNYVREGEDENRSIDWLEARMLDQYPRKWVH